VKICLHFKDERYIIALFLVLGNKDIATVPVTSYVERKGDAL
jgi:hypothetical protein